MFTLLYFTIFCLCSDVDLFFTKCFVGAKLIYILQKAFQLHLHHDEIDTPAPPGGRGQNRD